MSDVLQDLEGLSPEKRELLRILLAEKGVALDEGGIPPLPRDREHYPLSYAQQRLWFLDRLEPESTVYNIPLALRLTGPFHPATLTRALNALVQRHEVLRTTFTTVDGEAVQQIHPARTLTPELRNLADLPPADREKTIRRLARAEARRPFNLTTGPLLRVTLLRLAPQEHVLLLTLHHIIADGWSTGVLVREVLTLYEAFRRGKEPQLPPLPIQYVDFAAWQRRRLDEGVRDRQLIYWREQLAGVPPALDLPTDRPRPPLQTDRGATHFFTLPAHLADALRRLSRENGATLFMTLLAAFQGLLHRYTGQEDLCVGTPIANRNRAEIEGLIGFFVNTLVLRARPKPTLPFRDLLTQVKATTLAAYEHQDLPFEMVVEKAQPLRDMSRTPLFQVMFMLQNAPAADLSLPGLGIEQLMVDSGSATFDLTLALQEEQGRLTGALEYNADLFDAATVERLCDHYTRLLRGIIADPTQPLGDIPLLTTAERRQLLVEWNDTFTSFPAERTLHELVAEQAARTPDAVAVLNGDGETISYSQLDRRANQLAHRLHTLGVGRHSIVGLCMRRSPDMLVALLAALKAGGAYLPLDPSYPTERLAFMVADAHISLLLTQASLRDAFPDVDAPSLCLDLDRPVIEQQPATAPPSQATPDDPAYVIYTSGSTGRPKGVAVPHRAVINHNLAMRAHYNLTPADRVLQFATISFDAAVEEIFPTWLTGATLVLRDDNLPGPLELLRLVAEMGITVLELPTAYWHEMVVAVKETTTAIPPSLRLVAVGGEKAAAHHLAAWRRLAPGVAWLNTYGPTETTIVSTVYDPAGDPRAYGEGEIPIGRPIANTRLYVLDSGRRPVPIGVPGELYIGGAGVADGYLNRPKLTAGRFLPDPFVEEGDGRMYRTGDVVRYRADGQLLFVGRVDHQVKIRGFRIEPGEIAAALRTHPSVRDVLVTTPRRAGEERALVAYVIPAGARPIDSDEMRRALAEELPPYMIPAAFITLDAWPLLPNGKIDRHALPEPAWEGPAGRYVPPATPIEELLARICADLLDIEQIGMQDNFFDLGGHSLLATRLLTRIQHVFGVELPLRAIFDAPTVRDIAARISTARTAGAAAPPAMTPRLKDEQQPLLSFAQQRLWFLDQLQPDSPFYNIPAAVRLRGSLDRERLRRSLDQVVTRHEALRTTFPTVDGQPRQRIADASAVELPVVDLQSLPRAERESEVRRRAAAEAQRPFDLAAGPLLRVTLLQLEADEHVLLLTLHHIVGDETSIEILVQETARLYVSREDDSPLPPLPLQYADYAAWQREWLQGDVLDARLDYWRRKLADLPPLLTLPTDRPRPATLSYRGDYATFTLPAALTGAANRLARREGVTLFMTLLAAFQSLLHRYSGQERLAVGSPIAGRNRPELEPLIGFFVNTLVLDADFTPRLTFRQLLHQVRETTLGAYAHQELPFDMVVDALQPERNLSHTPLFQVMFVLQNTPPVQTRTLPGLRLEPVEAHSGTAKFDLTLFLTEEGDRLRGALEFNSDLFDPDTIRRLAGHFHQLLAAAVADPDAPLAELDLLTDAERRRLLLAWNDTHRPLPDLPAHRLVEQQVARTPRAVAVEDGTVTLSYGELNARANRLAHHLIDHGAGPETIVALCAHRTADLLTALLAILKSGAAYLPLDPAYPDQRLRFMLEDAFAGANAGPPLLVTESALMATLQPGDDIHTFRLDADWDQVDHRDHNPDVALTGENLAYVIYTSGSTGRPKGTLLTHRGLLNYLLWCRDTYGLDQHTRVPVHSSISFDLTITALLAPLVAGRVVHLLPDHADLEALADLLRGGDAALVKLTPAHLALLAQQLGPAAAARAAGSFVIGGEPLDADTVAFWRNHAPATRLFNEYGPTEAVVGCCVYEIPPDAELHGAVPIGTPIANTRLYVLDENRQLLPVGVPGELYIGGVQVARGYLNRPELTAERFVPDPFAVQRGDTTGRGVTSPHRLYRTGDRVRWTPDGQLQFLERLDHQVKIRGFRIELDEIEAALRAHPAVTRAAVVDREDVPGHKRLVAYVVPASANGELTLPALHTFLGRTLPDYMLPAALVLLDRLPLTANGKVDRRALPAPDAARPAETTGNFVAPRTPAEETLARIWTALLGVDRVGVHDNFFALGGDSILTIQVISRARQAGLHLLPRDLFQHPSVAGLAAAAARGRAIVAEQGPVTGPAPLTPIQHWFFEQDLPARHHWNQSLLLRVEQPLEPALLEPAVNALVKHHDGLRLRFGPTAEGWIQWHADPDDATEPPFEYVDLTSLPPGERNGALEMCCAQWQASLDLTHGPLCRAVLFEGGAGGDREQHLLLIFHHLVVDGVSWRILLEDLQLAYGQLAEDRPVRLPPKTTSFQTRARRLAAFAPDAPPWPDATARTTPLPRDFHDAGPNSEASTASLTVGLTAAETEALLHRVHEAYRTTVDDLLLTALAQTLAPWIGAEAVTVDRESHGRLDLFEDVDLSRTVGWFTALCPFRLALPDGAAPGVALPAVKEQLRQVPLEGVAYGVRRYLAGDNRLTEDSGAEVVFNYLGQMDQLLPAEGGFVPATVRRGAERAPAGIRPHLLSIDGGVAGGRLQLEWSYSTNVHRAETIRRLAEDYLTNLRALIDHCLLPDAGEVTATDFADFGWDESELEDILGEIDRTLDELTGS